MKYIVLSLDSQESILTFPRSVDDDEILDACKSIRFGDQRNWNRKFHDAQVISAGYIAEKECCGENKFLGIASRGKVDTDLLNKFDCKYIVFALDKDQPEMVTFPRSVDHDRMAEACEVIRFGHDIRANDKLSDGAVISAGFINDDGCHGRSETLNIGSRKQIDTILFSRSICEFGI